MPHGSELLIALLIPTALLVGFRINAALVFLSFCLGQVLMQTVASDADSVLHMAMPKASVVSTSTMQLILLCGPAVLTSVIMLFSVHGRARTIINIIPAIATGALALLLIEPILTPSLQHAVEANGIWHQFSRTQSFVVSVGAAMSLLFLWSQRRHAKHTEK